MISCPAAECWGETTDTEGTASCAVSVRIVAAVRRRTTIPNAATPAKNKKIAIQTIQPRFERRGLISLPSLGVSGGKTLMFACDCVAIIIPILVRESLSVAVQHPRLAAADCGRR